MKKGWVPERIYNVHRLEHYTYFCLKRDEWMSKGAFVFVEYFSFALLLSLSRSAFF